MLVNEHSSGRRLARAVVTAQISESSSEAANERGDIQFLLILMLELCFNGIFLRRGWILRIKESVFWKTIAFNSHRTEDETLADLLMGYKVYSQK